MYTVKLLPSAQRDVREIAVYISGVLGNPQAAISQSERLFDGIKSLSSFPYRRPVYAPLKALKHEYRALRVDRYLIFYWVNDAELEVVVARVLYGRADITHRFVSKGD